MSVRAYKIIEIKHEKAPTFNCYHDERVFDVANSENYNDGGIIEFETEAVKRELASVKKELKGLSGDADEGDRKQELLDAEKALEKILKECKANDGYQQYYCF